MARGTASRSPKSRDAPASLLPALALDQARHLETERTRLARCDALSRQSAKLGLALDHQEICRMTVRQAAALLNVTAAQLWLYEREQQEAHLGAGFGVGEEEGGKHRFKINERIVDLVLQQRQPIAITEAQSDPRLKLRGARRRHGFTSYAAAPLLCDEEPIGALIVAHRATRTFSRDDLAALGILANQAAIAFTNARLVRELRLAQEALAQGEKMSALGMMVSGVAHELNNPLTSISGNAQLLKLDAQLSAKEAKRVEVILQGVERCSRIVRGLLAFARKYPPEKRLISVNNLISDVLDLRRHDLARHNIAIRTDLAPGDPFISAAAHQLHQVLLNLLLNAEQAIGEDGEIAVRSWRADGVVGIEVTDTGRGMPPEIVARVFDPFFTTKPEGLGTGLGLAVSRGIIESHGGTIEVESTVGQGSRFRLTLPASEPPPAAAAAAQPGRARTRLDAKNPANPGRVLIVDDDELVARTLREQLVSRGIRADVATTGAAAHALLGKKRFQALIVDLYLNGQSGVRFLERVWDEHPEYRSQSLLITGEPQSTNGLCVNGATLPVLTKPFRLEELTAALANLGAASASP